MKIAIHHVTKTYPGPIQALQDIDLTIPAGMFGLLCPNGAGKTTLIRILAGIMRPTTGVVCLEDIDATTQQGQRALKRLLGYVPQEFGGYPEVSVYEFLDYLGMLKGLRERRTRHRRVEEVLELVSLGPVARRQLKTFSGGMKRRVGIAQALLGDPRLLIVDEPTAGLDPEERIRIRNLLAELATQNRIVILSSHLAEDIAQTCQQVAILKSGCLAFQGTISHLLKQAHGQVWSVATQDRKPGGDVTIISTRTSGKSTQYRVVGTPSSLEGAVAVEPTLEDGYIWVMHQLHQ